MTNVKPGDFAEYIGPSPRNRGKKCLVLGPDTPPPWLPQLTAWKIQPLQLWWFDGYHWSMERGGCFDKDLRRIDPPEPEEKEKEHADLQVLL